MAEIKVGQKYKRTHGSYAGHVAEVTVVGTDTVHYKPGLYEDSGSWMVEDFLRDWVPVEEPKPEIKVGQKYRYEGMEWGSVQGTLTTITGISGERIDTAPGSWDFRDFFFSTEADLINSGKTMGYVLAEDVEVRSVSSTGAEKGVKASRFSLLPMEALTEVANHYGVGATKYEDHNMRRGYEWSKSYDALMRHATQFWAGEDRDEETGSKHLSAVVFHALTLMEFMETHPEFDDRYKLTK